MEVLKSSVNDARFDELVHGGVPECGNLELAVKRRATEAGRPGVVISFTAHIDGKNVPVQAVTTLDLLHSTVNALVIGARKAEGADVV